MSSFATSPSEQRNSAVYCHSCARNTTAALNQSSEEYECTICGGCFVEQLDQGVEDFVTGTEVPNNQPGDGDNSSTVNNRGSSESSASTERPSRTSDLTIRQIGTLTTAGGIPIATVTGGDGGGGLNALAGILAMLEDDSNDGNTNAGGMLSLFSSLLNLRNLQTGGLSGAGGAMGDQQFEMLLNHILMNEQSHAGAPPAAESLISALPRVNITEATDRSSLQECSISQENFQVGDVMVQLPCGHNFKEEPITHWLQMHNTCPVCRVEIR